MAQVTIYHDFSSPFSYLGTTQIEAVCERTGAELVWHPMVLGALFRSVGTPMVPMMAVSTGKRNHMVLDIVRYSDALDVPFHWPSRFPMKTIGALRLVLAAGEADPDGAVALTHRIYRAFWAEDRDISQPHVLAGLAEEVGLDGAALLARTAEADLKKKLFDYTQAAEDAGVFGAPTFIIDGEELIWGQDRLEIVEWMLADRGPTS